MKTTIKVEQEVDLRMLQVEAGVRYWEDASVNGVEDVEGELIPFRDGQLWKPLIYLETGQIAKWPQGKTASIHYSVNDSGSYHLLDATGKTVLSIENDYVPKMLSPGGNGYGDYIIMDIDENGFIQNWEFDLDGFVNED